MNEGSFATAQVVAIAIALVACVTDLRSRRIPNLLTFGSALMALVFHVVIAGSSGLLHALGGWGAGVLMFLPFFALRGLGGGDVKLLADRVIRRRFEDAAEVGTELCRNRQIFFACQQHVLGIRVEPRELLQQVPDIGADAEVVQFSGIDGHAHSG